MKAIFTGSLLLRWGIATTAALLTSLSSSIPAIAEPSKQTDKLAQAMKELMISEKKWIEIRLGSQRLIAWEGDKPVYAVIVSTGKPGHETPVGTFAIQTKHEIARMQGDDYDVPDVPNTMYYSGSYAIHGAYWHHNFGTPVSHGCTNVAPNHAKWLFNWASVGTPIVVHSGTTAPKKPAAKPPAESPLDAPAKEPAKEPAKSPELKDKTPDEQLATEYW
jgi:lipoprotein-anchoring transpeptidase ErfK/SrfK